MNYLAPILFPREVLLFTVLHGVQALLPVAPFEVGFVTIDMEAFVILEQEDGCRLLDSNCLEILPSRFARPEKVWDQVVVKIPIETLHFHEVGHRQEIQDAPYDAGVLDLGRIARVAFEAQGLELFSKIIYVNFFF